MAVDGMRFLVQLRKLTIRTMRVSSRSVRNHPVLMGVLLFVILLYRSSPFLFSLLVSASPVLVCTAVLLGTLLSFGNPQIPEIDMDEKISCEVSSLRSGLVPNSTIVYQKEADMDAGDSASLGGGDVCSVSRFEESLLTTQNSREIVFERRSVGEEEKDELKSHEVEFSTESNQEDHGILHGLIIDDHFEAEKFEETSLTFEGAADAGYEVQERGFENEGSDDGNGDDHVPWTRVNGDHGDDEDDDEDDDDDSGSDGAESSSPDPSMADIIPLLDELHPLIECESLIPRDQSHEDSGLLGNGSHASSINSGEESDHNSGEEEDKEEEEAGDNDVEEENREAKEDGKKSAISWTEDDQKNLMDLGSSELERNQRLESLIARRRARKSNLIDLDDLVLPFQIAPISTARQNPFDFPNDNTFDNMNLPPIPGSAPSIMLQRRNPFDIPYDSGEEKPDLMDDSFQQEFTPTAQKEPVFRRHESFHVGSSSFFEFPRQEPRDFQRVSRFKPYFIPERLASEGGSSFNSFRRQSSEASDESSFHLQMSELSGSLSFHRQTSGISEASSFQRQSSDISESKASSAAETELVSAEPVREETKVDDPEIDRGSEHVEHGSQSSENFDSQIEKSDFDIHMPEIVLGESEAYGTEFTQPEQGLGAAINLGSSGNDRNVDSWVSEARDLAAIGGIIEGDMHLSESPVEDAKEENEGSVKVEEIGYHSMENSDVQSENLFNTSDFHQHHSRNNPSAERSVFDTNLTLETIEEEHITSPSSSLTSEERNITEALEPAETLMNVHHTSPDNSNPDFPTELALDLSNSGLNMDLEGSSVEDPVYDLSPQASRVNLSISSEELADLGLERVHLLHKSVGEDDARVDREDQIIFVDEERHAETETEHPSAEADFVSTDNLSTEEPDLSNEDGKTVDVSDTVAEQLISVAEGGESVQDHCLITSPPFHYEEEPFVVPEKLEEVSSEYRLHTEIDPEMNDLLSFPLQTAEASTTVQDLSQDHVTDFIDLSEPVEGDADEQSQFTDPFVPQADIITQLDEALLSELDVVGDFHVTELGTAFEAQNTEAIINELQDSGMSEDESVESIEKPNDEDTQKSSSDVFFINESQPEVESAEVVTGEFEHSPVLESEPIENVKQPSDVNAEKSASEYEPKAEVADAGLAVESYVLESTSTSHLPEPESSQSDEISRTSESISLQDELLLDRTVVDTSVVQKVTVVEATEPFSALEEEIKRSDEKDEPAAGVFDSVYAVEQEIERSHVAAIDGSSDSSVLESTLTEKDESAEEKINEFVHVMEEEIGGSSIAAVDLTNSRFLERKGESAEEINEFVHVMEEEVERDELTAAETNETVPAMEEEIGLSAIDASSYSNIAAGADDETLNVVEENERSVIDAFLDSSDPKIDAQIENDDQPTSGSNDFVPAMEEDVEGGCLVYTSSDSENDARIDKDEQHESVPTMEEDVEGGCFFDASSDSENDAQIDEDEQHESFSTMGGEIISVDASLHSRASVNEALIENEETSDSIAAMEEKIEGSNAGIDTSSDSHFLKNGAQNEKDEELAEETNELVPTMEEEIERSFFKASRLENEEAGVSSPVMEEEVEGSVADNVAAIDTSSDTQIEKDEQPDAEICESVPAMEEEIERSSADAFTDSQASENNAVVEHAETNEADLAMEQDRVFSNAFSDNIVKDEELAAETNEPFPTVEEDVEASNADNATAIDTTKNDAQIQKDGLVPAVEDSIDAFLDSQPSENDVLNPLTENTETNESTLVMEEEKESIDAGIDTSSDSHVSNSQTLIEKDVPALGNEIHYAEEMEFHEAEPFPDTTIRHLESEKPTSSQLESAESQVLREEDHQLGPVEHLNISTEIASDTEETVIQGSTDTPKREEE